MEETSRSLAKRLLGEKKYREILERLGERRRTVRVLRSILYEEEDLLRWRAVTMMGNIAAWNPDLIRNEVSRLLWSLNEEAGSMGRGAAEAISEIARSSLRLAADAARVVVKLLEDPEVSRPPNRNPDIVIGVLWGIGRLGEKERTFVESCNPDVASFLPDPHPGVRAHAAWCLGHAGDQAALGGLESLVDDKERVLLYEEEELQEKSVGRIAGEAIRRLAF